MRLQLPSGVDIEIKLLGRRPHSISRKPVVNQCAFRVWKWIGFGGPFVIID